MAWNKQTFLVFGTAILLISSQIQLVQSAKAGGSGGGGGVGGGGGRGNTGGSSSSGGQRYSGSSGSYGSSSGTSSLNRQSQINSGRSPAASRWGDSAPSGVNRVSGASSPGYARANYGVAGTSAVRSSNNRPAVNAPVASQDTLVQPMYNTHYTTINNFGGGASRGGFGMGSLLLAGAGGAIGGYMLGSMIASSVYRDHSGCCYGCGCSYYGPPPPYYYDTYVPYRYRYQDQSSTTVTQVTNTTTAAIKPIDICTLARWNMELPFTELPNMLLTFLSNDSISGESITDKSKFIFEFFNTTAAPYGSLNATSNVFTIPSTFDLNVCNFNIPRPQDSNRDGLVVNGTESDSNTGALGTTTTTTTTTNAPSGEPWFGGIVLNQWRQQVRNGDRSICVTASFAHIPECDTGPKTPKIEEPFVTSVKQIVRLYSNLSSDQQMTAQLVASTKRCYPQNVTPPKEIRPCLDYSISSDQATSLLNQSSLFDNEEICRKYLNPNISSCVPNDSTFSCTVSDLVNLNVFVRNYYLCDEAVDPSLIVALQARQSNAGKIPEVLAGTIATNKIIGNQLTSSGTGSSRTNTFFGFFMMVLATSLSLIH